MTAQNLKLGYQYTKENISFFFENGLYVICGFINDKHIYNTYTTFLEAKKFYNSIK
mgnify:FL=1